MTKEIDWSKARAGQKVWHGKFGSGKVAGIDLEKYPVVVVFEGDKVVRFTACGRLYFSEEYPSLFAGHDVDYGTLDKFRPERLGEITKNVWAYVSDVDDYEEAKNRGKHFVLFDENSTSKSKYLSIAGGLSFQRGVGLIDWNYAWEIQDE